MSVNNKTSFNLFFKLKWKLYVAKFGKDLDELFTSDLDKRINLSKCLDYLLKKDYNNAYHKLKTYKDDFKTSKERNIYNKLINYCYNDSQMKSAKIGDWIKHSNSGYYQIISKTNDYAIIKEGFDYEFVDVLESKRINGYQIMISDLKTFKIVSNKEKRKIKRYFNKNQLRYKKFLQNTTKILEYRRTILEFDFIEASFECRQFHFYKITKDKVAFIINLKDYGDYIKIYYGFTSIIDDDYFKKHGENIENIKFRFECIIRNSNDELKFYKIISNIYHQFKSINNDELLELKKNRQKIFLKNINEKLKPLGFVKNNVRWTKKLEDNYFLEFYAEKSHLNDVYYFNFKIYNSYKDNLLCYHRRTDIIVDWQILSKIECDLLMDSLKRDIIYPIIDTPFDQLYKNKDISQYSFCNKKKCDKCILK